jgi:TorA maturation chaperone TorD
VFLEGHLRRWLPQFSQRVGLAATSPYYSQWAQMADLFTHEDVRRLRGVAEARE